jgi:hypothetical protein
MAREDSRPTVWPIKPNYAYLRVFPEKKRLFIFYGRRGAVPDGELTFAAKLTPLQTKSRPKPAKK